MKQFNIILLLTIATKLSCGSAMPTTTSKAEYDPNAAHFMFSGGLSLQKELMGEAGVIYGYSWKTGQCNPGGIAGIKASSEFNFNPDRFVIGPKVSVVVDIAIIGMGLSLIDYTDFTDHDLRLTPEIGLSLDGYINLLYGYNIPLGSQRLDFVAKDRLTLRVNLDRRWWE